MIVSHSVPTGTRPYATDLLQRHDDTKHKSGEKGAIPPEQPITQTETREDQRRDVAMPLLSSTVGECVPARIGGCARAWRHAFVDPWWIRGWPAGPSSSCGRWRKRLQHYFAVLRSGQDSTDETERRALADLAYCFAISYQISESEALRI